jgi:hypothetical protein
MIAKIEAQTKLLEIQIAEQSQTGLEVFSARELSVLGLVPESSAVVQFEGREALGLPSPAEAQALLKGTH